jgi:hypothetical protein
MALEHTEFAGWTRKIFLFLCENLCEFCVSPERWGQVVAIPCCYSRLEVNNVRVKV